MKLITTTIQKLLSEYDESRYNKEYRPHHYFTIIQIINPKINTHKLNLLHYKYLLAKQQHKTKLTTKYRQIIENEIIQHRPIIHKYLQTHENETQQQNKKQLWSHDTIGYLSYEED